MSIFIQITHDFQQNFIEKVCEIFLIFILKLIDVINKIVRIIIHRWPNKGVYFNFLNIGQKLCVSFDIYIPFDFGKVTTR